MVQSGIDRNFIRECEKQGIIAPKRNDSIDIINKQYVPRDYTQNDLETVWCAYLCRKMGMSYTQTKKYIQGEEISLRDTIISVIQKYENQMEEIKALISFMEYVKTVGFIPSPPKELLGSRNFKDFLLDFMIYLDKDHKITRDISIVANLAAKISDSDELELDSDQADNLIRIVSTYLPNSNTEYFTQYGSVMLAFRELADSECDPDCEKAQRLVKELYDLQKQSKKDYSLSDFADMIIYIAETDSDISDTYLS